MPSPAISIPTAISQLLSLGMRIISLRALVDLDKDAVGAEGPGLDELQLQPVDAVREQAPAAAEDRREDHQPQLVDEARLQQRRHESPAAGDEDVAVGLVPEP